MRIAMLGSEREDELCYLTETTSFCLVNISHVLPVSTKNISHTRTRIQINDVGQSDATLE